MSDSATEILGGGMLVQLEWSTANIALFSVCVITLSSLVFYECLLGLPYSKFGKQEHIVKAPGPIQKFFHYRISTRVAWITAYSSAALGYAILFVYYALENQERIGKYAPSETYSLILLIGWEVNFIKRVLECAFLHIFSDTVPILTFAVITFGYTHLGLLCVYFSNQVQGYEISSGSPTFTKDILCIVGYCVGMSTNFYAHVRLRNIRKQSGQDEAIKKYFSLEELGPLFQIFVCPQYVFEILHFVCWSIFGATAAHYLVAFGVTSYLSLRTKSTYQWYKAKGLVKRQVEDAEGGAATHYIET
eukprot:CAMPEP_0184009962 /NCGR_PEP_ID=MMETSP0954-20121128/2922_1 /TAXON_ID=627963 /ORGANISM="Aplanochytrium sp, Strain PBS07" /LENGTH=303 /DNA_ID=CAMNT_0026289445 /DNA_START=123 /DNA_END=1034 /DNA_ORIENTATION=+